MPEHESNEPDPTDYSVPPAKIALIAFVVLGGVVLGSFVVIKTDQPGKAQPLHQLPASEPGNAAAPQSADGVRAASASTSDAGTPVQDARWKDGMAYLPGGTFWMGSEAGHPDEAPLHEVTLDGFWIDRTEVTNAEFARFVDETGYVTVAERRPDPKLYPGVPEDKLVPGSVVFNPPDGVVSLENHYIWWKWVEGAHWRRPEGPDSSINGRMDHPVVHISWDDAVAYAAWAGKRLPTEAEWEYAARGGRERSAYIWGEEQVPEGRWMANIWQGRFPGENTVDDGFLGTGPVGAFDPNAFGLYDMAGNVWEWCADWYMPNYYEKSPAKNPSGPNESFDPNEPGMWKRVQRGGSFLCSDLYCTGYRPSARMKNSPDTGTSHTGFRCVKIAPGP